MSQIDGFFEKFGISVEIMDYVSRVLNDTARQYGYSQICIPIIEKAASYSEDVVGKSPWPEWNRKGCFFFDILNYHNSYTEKPEHESVLLIPEGTVSVTRWLGDQLVKGAYSFPPKVFYNLHCYRNELISTLNQTKRREFSQFGLEILGSSNPHSDLEILCIAVYCLIKLGVRSDQIRIRLNDITIFNQLVAECGLNSKAVYLKELLDTLAEIKAGKGVERRAKTLKSIHAILDEANLNNTLRAQWQAIIEQQGYRLDKLNKIFGSDYQSKIDNLAAIRSAFEKINIHIAPDLCVIRSHEYYTSVSYEIDVLTDEHKYIEIAGGGRYDRLVSSFVPANYPIQQVPCTGFAFGMERIISMLEQEHLIGKEISIHSTFYFNSEQSSQIIPEGDAPSDYINAFAETLLTDRPTSILIR